MDSGSPPLTFPVLLAGTLSRWRITLAVAGGTVLLALTLALILPPTYRGTASFVTADAGLKLNTGGLSDLATDPGISGIATQLGLGSSRDRSESPLFYEQLLSSRELLTRLLLSRFPDPGVRLARPTTASHCSARCASAMMTPSGRSRRRSSGCGAGCGSP